VTLPPPPLTKKPAPAALGAPKPLAPPSLAPAYTRVPAITKEALQHAANEAGVNVYWQAYSIVEPEPWPMGYMFWMTDRRKECGAHRGLLPYVIEYINRTPTRTA
jgi:hypothetical protein